MDNLEYLLNTKNKNELIKYLSKLECSYRQKLLFPKKLHFGIEIETENIEIKKRNEAIKKIKEKYGLKYDSSLETKNYNIWQYYFDCSLKNNGLEIVSPILTDNEKTWEEIKEICTILNKSNCNATSNTASHVHFNADFFEQNYKAFIKLIKLYLAYENIIIKYGFGSKGIARTYFFNYSTPATIYYFSLLEQIEDCESMIEISCTIPKFKNIALNLRNVDWINNTFKTKNTIEFRSANGTINPIEWQNLIYTYGQLLLTAKNKEVDEEYLSYKIFLHGQNAENNNSYSYINLEEAIEFANIIFENAKDKLLFIKQYLSNYNCKNCFKNVK